MLITGCTGFVGKVVLEKIIRCMPTFRKIFVLVRPKRGVNPRDRIMKDIFSSECFSRVRKEKEQEFDNIIKTKIIPIEGDICKDGLALKQEDRYMLTNELTIIMNIAASVDFNERISDAL